MSRKNGEGSLGMNDVINLLNAIIPRLNGVNVQYWLIGGVLDDIVSLGNIAGPHSDIDFYVLKHDRDLVYSCLASWAVQNDMNTNDTGNLHKLTFTRDTITDSTNTMNASGYSIEFVFLHDQDNTYSSSINEDLPKVFAKQLLGEGVLTDVSELTTKISVPNQAKKLLHILDR